MAVPSHGNVSVSMKLDCISPICSCSEDQCQLSRIVPVGSPVLTVYYGKQPLNITIDSGATTSFITKEMCMSLSLKIVPNGKLIKLGDGCTTLAAIGEVDVTLSRDKWNVRLRAIVVKTLSSDIYGGMTFLIDNDISLRPSKGEIKVLNKYVIYQTNTMMLPPQVRSMESKSKIIKPPRRRIFPVLRTLFCPTSNEKDNLQASKATLDLPEDIRSNYVFIEPRHENEIDDWPPMQICEVKDGKIIVENNTSRTLTVPKDLHLIGVTPTEEFSLNELVFDHSNYVQNEMKTEDHQLLKQKGIDNALKIDISRVPLQLQSKVKDAHLKYSDVFIPDLSQGYNGTSGKHFVRLQFADENRPMMNKCKIPKWAGKLDRIKQLKMDSLESQGVLIDPYKHNVKIKMISPCFLRVKARAKEKELEDCDLSELRWIISPSQLNPYLRQLQTKNVSKEDLFIFKAEKPHCVEFDLFDGYFQNHIHKDDWGYLAVETPFKGIRVLTRSGQGLLNQEIEMSQLLTKVLGSEIQKGNVIIQADDGQVGGGTETEAIDNWINVLRLCSENNIKLGHTKVKILPSTSLIHGWIFKDGHIQPDPHRKLALLDSKTPSTIGEMRTYMGVYKTFFPAMPKLSNIMSPFEKLCAGQDSKSKIAWDDDLKEKFEVSKLAAEKNIKILALPTPGEQLFIVPDAACKDTESKKPALGFILFVSREPRAEPVMFVSWRMGDEYWSWSPCELEGLGASIAVEKCSFFILRSDKPTLVFPDNKCVIQAFEKLKKGRYSTSQRLATFTNKMQRFPIILQHGSGRLLQNIGSDYISRNALDCKDSKCTVCEFAREKGESVLASLVNLVHPDRSEIDLRKTFTILASAVNNFRDIPFGNSRAWFELQSNDKAISEALKLKKSGQQPPKKSPFLREIKYYVSNCVISPSTQLLVKEEKIPYETSTTMRVVIPQAFLEPMLIQLHHDQNCPAPSQLRKLFERYFFAFQPKDVFSTVTSYCRKCQARKLLPKEIKHFNSVTDPKRPGTVFVSDIMRRAKQCILVTRDAFSDFVSTKIVESESKSDLKEGLIFTTNNTRSNSEIIIRTDNAPGFLALANDEDLRDLKISIQTSDSKNKNGVAIVDKAIQELQKELVILSPEGKQINNSILSKATLALNSRIRNRDLSAYEIMFCREQNTGSNFNIDDRAIAEKKMKLKIKNHQYSEKSKFGRYREPDAEILHVGDFVYLKEDGDKHKLKDLYLVVGLLEKNVTIIKVLHEHDKSIKTKFGTKRFTVPLSSVFKADNDSRISHRGNYEIPEDDKKITSEDVLSIWSVFPQKTTTSSESSLDDEYNILNNSVNETPTFNGNSDQPDQQSSCSMLNVPMYDDHQMPFIDGQLIQRPPPKKNDIIYFYHRDFQKWVKAKLSSNEIRGYKNYYNIQYEDGTNGGVYLKPNERWTLWGETGNELNRVIRLDSLVELPPRE